MTPEQYVSKIILLPDLILNPDYAFETSKYDMIWRKHNNLRSLVRYKQPPRRNIIMRAKSIKFLEKSNIELSFTDKIITSYGGFSLLAKLFEKVKLHEKIDEIFPVTEISPNSKVVSSQRDNFLSPHL